MTESPTTTPGSPTPVNDPQTTTPAGNTIGLVALIIAGVGFLLGVIPATSGLAWLLLLPALILAIVGLTRKGKKKGTSIAALVLSVVGWIVAVIVASAAFLAGVGEAIDQVDAAPTSGSQVDEGEGEEEGEEETEAAIGDTVTNADGVGFTVSAIACGLATAGGEFLNEEASGQFCEVKFTVANGSNEAVNVSASDVTAFIGEAEYDVEATVSTFGDDIFSTDVNPGLSADCVVYIDIPAEATLDYIKYQPLFSFDEGVIVKAS